MARRGSFQPRGFTRRPAVSYGWSLFATAAFIDVAAATTVTLGALVPTIDTQLVVERVRGVINVISDQNMVERQIGAFGMLVVSGDAFAAGAASMPSPFDDADASWQVYHPFARSGGEVLTTLLGPSETVDSKAKRIVQPNEVLNMAVSNFHATDALRIAVVIRILSRVRG